MPRLGIAALSTLLLLLGALPLEIARADATVPIGPEVVNGRPPSAGEFAFLAEIRAYVSADQFYTCGGSFVSATQVVTAAHCVAEEEGEEIIAVEAGAADGSREPVVLLAASRVQIHERFSSKTGANDIALITLTRPLEGVATVSIPTAVEWTALTSPGAPVQSAGWGSTYSGGDNVADFLVADLSAVPDAVCADARAAYPIGPLTFYGIGVEFDPATMICAGGVTSGGLPIDTCQGDSGGPLTARRGNETFLVGIVSWGLGCAGVEDGELIPLTPGVYTRLGTQLGWLALHGVGEPITPPGRVHGFSQGPTVGVSPRLRVTVRWQPPRVDGASTVTHYRARYGSDGQWTRWKHVERTSLRLNGLRDDERYRVQVRAVNAAGAGPRASYRLR